MVYLVFSYFLKDLIEIRILKIGIGIFINKNLKKKSNFIFLSMLTPWKNKKISLKRYTILKPTSARRTLISRLN